MNSIRVTNKDLYVIEVNDNGDTIALAKNDVDLPLKIQGCLDDIRAVIAKIEKMENSDGEVPEGDIFNETEKANMEIVSQGYKDMRKALDRVFGDGASQKIFGDNNWLEMFDDFFEAMRPHFKALGFESDDKLNKKVIEAVEEKYGEHEDIL